MPRRPDMPPLRRDDLAGDPIDQFADWWERAEAEVPLPDAICLATVDADGAPDARMVLLKGFGADGFRFHTNYESAKGGQLSADGRAAIVVYWRELDRQVRIRGPVETPQRRGLGRVLQHPAARAPGRRVGIAAEPPAGRPRRAGPPGRRGRGAVRRRARSPGPRTGADTCCAPESVEFWQGQVGRLHDRFRYRREGGGWAIERLGP